MYRYYNNKHLKLVSFLFFAVCGCVSGSTFYPKSLSTQKGSASSTSLSALQNQDQNGSEDTWAKYVEFYGSTNAYQGVFTFDVSSIDPNTVSAFTLDVNFKGPKSNNQVWQFEYYSPCDDTWILTGDNSAAASWEWTTLSYCAQNTFASVVSEDFTVKLRLSSTSKKDDCDIDFLAITTIEDGTVTPTSAPTTKPSTAPTSRPPTAPTTRPTQEPTERPTEEPTEEPTSAPTQKATAAPTQKATSAPTQKATAAPTQKATSAPTQKATAAPTQKATAAPTQKATAAPTQKATSAPTQKATSAPTQKATSAPTQKATSAPTQKATAAPTQKATAAPTQKATSAPTQKATAAPTQKATAAPTQKATSAPTQKATSAPTNPPSNNGGRTCPAGQVWVPSPGTTWQWQLTGTIDQSWDVQMYDIDLFDASAATVASLQAKGRVVICYFSTQYEDWRPDASKFTSSILGANLDDWPGERYVDIRSAALRKIMTERLDLAVTKGCDGVEPDNVDGYTNSNGLGLKAADQIEYNKFLATEAHKRGLSIGLKNDLDQVGQLVSSFDWALNEQCNEYGECSMLNPFITAGKAVFGVEYTGSSSKVCPTMVTAKMSWLMKDLDLGAKSTQCCPTGGCPKASYKCVSYSSKRSEIDGTEEFTADDEVTLEQPTVTEEQVNEQVEFDSSASSLFSTFSVMACFVAIASLVL